MQKHINASGRDGLVRYQPDQLKTLIGQAASGCDIWWCASSWSDVSTTSNTSRATIIRENEMVLDRTPVLTRMPRVDASSRDRQ
jgi:hypothetical protein